MIMNLKLLPYPTPQSSGLINRFSVVFLNKHGDERGAKEGEIKYIYVLEKP